jgi:hypothetical protein
VNVTASGIRVWFWPILAALVLAGCSNAPVASPAATTTAPIGNTQSAIRAGCQHLAQLKHQVSEALDSSDAAARLNSISSGAAWKAVSGIGLAAGLSAKYQQFVVDEAVLDNGYAAAISGGPPTSLKGALSKLSTDCHKEGQTVRQ